MDDCKDDKHNNWFRMYLKGCGKIALMGLHAQEHNVLYVLFSKLRWNSNKLTITQVEIADILGLHKQSVNRAIKTLIEKSIISIIDRKGRCYTYMLNSEFGVMGGKKGYPVSEQ